MLKQAPLKELCYYYFHFINYANLFYSKEGMTSKISLLHLAIVAAPLCRVADPDPAHGTYIRW